MTLLIGLIGAVIGAGASILTMWIQTRVQARRDRLRLASELALDEFRIHLEHATKQGKPANVQPLVSYIYFHLELSKLVERGAVTVESLRDLTREQKEVESFFINRA